MPAESANVTSLEALERIRAALLKFAENAEAALVNLELEARRPVEWVEDDRTRYWPQQARLAIDAVSEARIALERCEARISSEDSRYCYDERKSLEKAKRRVHLCEAKIVATRRWRMQLSKDAEELKVHISKFRHFLETDFVRAIAMLDRMMAALGKYVNQAGGMKAEG